MIPDESESQEITVFDEYGDNFESLAKINGQRIWHARTLMRLLGYESWPEFMKARHEPGAD